MGPGDSKLVAASFRELDAAYRMGVRLVGCDDSPHSLYPTHWKPSLAVLHERWSLMLYARYPDVQWIIETAACDLQHVWGSSSMWSREMSGLCTFSTGSGRPSNVDADGLRRPSEREGVPLRALTLLGDLHPTHPPRTVHQQLAGQAERGAFEVVLFQVLAQLNRQLLPDLGPR